MVRHNSLVALHSVKFKVHVLVESDENSEHFEAMKCTLRETNKSVNKSLAENKETLLKGQILILVLPLSG